MRGLLGTVLVLLLGLHTLPYLVRDQLVLWLRSQGAAEARLQALEVDWLNGEIRLQGLYAAAPGRPVLQLEALSLELDYASLTQQRLLLEQISLRGLSAGLREQGQALWLGPVDLNGFQRTAPEGPEPVTEPSRWSFGVQQVVLANIHWRAEIAQQDLQLELDQATLADLYLWDQQRSTEIRMQGRINRAPFALDTRATPLPEHKQSSINLKLENFPLHSITRVFEPRLQATLDLDLSIGAELAADKGQLAPQGSVRLRDLTWRDEGLQLTQQALRWEGRLALELAALQPSRLSGSGSLQLQGTALQQAARELALQQLNWSGDLELALSDNQPRQLRSGSRIALTALALKDEAAGEARLQQMLWQATTDLRFSNGQPQSLQLTEGALQLQGLAAADGERRVQLAALQWAGDLGLALEDGQPRRLQLDKGRLQLQQLRAEAAARSVNLAALALSATASSEDLQQFRLQLPALQLQQLALAANNQTLLSLADVRAQQLQLDHDTRLSLQQLEMQGLEVAGRLAPLSRLQQLTLSQLTLDELTRLRIEQLALLDSQSRIHIDAAGELADLAWLRQQLAAGAAAAAESAATTGEQADEQAEATAVAPFQWQLGELLLSGNHRLQLQDESVAPAYKADLNITHFRLGALDSARVQASPFSLDARLNGFARLNAEGELELTGPAHNGQWQAQLSGVDLPALSPYALKYSGYYIHAGQFDLDAKGAIREGVLESSNALRLNRLDVEPGDAELMAEFSRRLTMPLETALAVLQDSDDNIALDVPVSGPLHDLDFGYQSIVNLLAKKGVKKAALSYLSKALQPYGTLISLASSAVQAVESGAFITLQPVAFGAGSSELLPDADDYLGKIAELLNERQALRLNICGTAVPQDQPLLARQLDEANKQRAKPLPAEALQAELAQQMQLLAQARGNRVKQQLLPQVAGERLFLCYPKVQPEGEPLVQLGL